jgi:hypothetical protein
VTQADLDRSLTKTQFFIDPTSGAVLKIAYTNFSETNPDSGQAVEIYFSDFRVINGERVPFRQTEFDDGVLESDLTLTSITFNNGLADTDFSLPQ